MKTILVDRPGDPRHPGEGGGELVEAVVLQVRDRVIDLHGQVRVGQPGRADVVQAVGHAMPPWFIQASNDSRSAPRWRCTDLPRHDEALANYGYACACYRQVASPRDTARARDRMGMALNHLGRFGDARAEGPAKDSTACPSRTRRMASA